MMKNVTQLKCTVNGKENVFLCDIDCSTIEVKESLYQFLKYVGQVEDAHAAKLKAEQDEKVDIDNELKEAIIEG